VGEVIFVEVLDRRGRLLARQRIERSPITIGRAYANDVIVDDPYVCPAHLRILGSDDGTVLVEDLGSVNGTHGDPDGPRIGRATLPSDARVRIGNTILRFRRDDAPVPPALVHAWGAGASSLFARTPVALASWLVVGLLLMHSVFIEGYERPQGWRVAGLGVLLVLGISVWAAAWALITRVVTHEWRFLAHASVACVYLGLDLIGDTVQGYVAFLGAGTWPATLLSTACDAVPLAWLLGAHLALVGTMRVRRRLAVATVTALCLVGLFTFASHWRSFEFSRQIQFDAALRPLPPAWIPGAPVDAILAEVPELEREVRRLAKQRPRSGGWMPELGEGDRELGPERDERKSGPATARFDPSVKKR
jgi:hypothetical protein